MYFVYILYSVKLGKYYIGQTHDVELRLCRHNEGYYDNWTSKGLPWILFLTLSCKNRKQAFAVEKHIKSMKSKKYIENLAQYPEMREKLIFRFEN